MMKKACILKQIYSNYSLLIVLIVVLILNGCASTPQHTLSPNTFEPVNMPSRNQPQSNRVLRSPQTNFLHNLPLGIGGRFELFVSETASEASEFYHDHLEPMRNGKMFLAKPYVVDYSIMPSSGDLFRLDNVLHDKTVKSDYDFRVGMTRRYSNFSDFFNTDFWIAKGEYGPEPPKHYYRNNQQDPYDFLMFGQTETYQPAEPYIEPEFDVNTILNSEWDLPIEDYLLE